MDLENWNNWTASIQSIDRLDEGPLRLGSRVKVKQPRLPPLVWTVVEFDAENVFTWRATRPGLVWLARHAITETGATQLTVTLTVEQSGTLDRWVSRLVSKHAERYVQMEASGLKERSESAF